MSLRSDSVYRGRRVALATRHAKERALGPPLSSALGLELVVPPDLDTDALGSFSGVIRRPAPPRETALRKAQLGLTASGLPLGLASEGSYGPHPASPFLSAGLELLVFVDQELELVVTEELLDEAPCFHHLELQTPDAPELADFLRRAQFPSHGLFLAPADLAPELAGPEEASEDPAGLRAQLASALARSPGGRLRLWSDLRAHRNPTRLAAIGRVGERLARRLATPCPACDRPGFGRVGVVRGLPCRDCRTPSEWVAAELLGCGGCPHREQRARSEGPAFVDPRWCERCNP